MRKGRATHELTFVALAALAWISFEVLTPGTSSRERSSSSGTIPTEPLPIGGTRVPARKTPLRVSEVLRLVQADYRRRFGATLTERQAAVLVAQWAVETGWGAATYNFNFGNLKAPPSWTGWFVVLLTWELHSRAGKLRRERWRAPFRAFQSPQEGVRAWLDLLFGARHGQSRTFVLAVDPRGYGRSLANRADGGSGYATERADRYGSAIAAAYKKIIVA